MRGEKDPERLRALRQRLYERGSQMRDKISKDTPINSSNAKDKLKVSENWSVQDNVKEVKSEQITPGPKVTKPSTSYSAMSAGGKNTATMPKNKRQSFRLNIILVSLAVFVGAVVLSSLFIVFGGNTISGDNINISINGPFTVSGGDIMNLQIGIVNDNTVPIESATLVIDYPRGTRAVDEEGNEKELFVERLPLEKIESGETVNIPLKVRVYGEENEELTINASVEYRVSGSNSTFFKQAEGLRFKISSSPVVMSLNSLKTLASGQENEVEVRIISNASTELKNLLLRVEYPSGFDYIDAVPQPTSGRNAWLIESLKPEEIITITITGVALADQPQSQVINASLGTPSDRDEFNLSSTFTTASLDYQIESPFIAGSIAVGQNSSGNVSVNNGSSQNVVINIRNNLDQTIYNGIVTAKLSGSALLYTGVGSNSGFYDSNTNTVTWDVSSFPSLSRLEPGESEKLSFSVNPEIRNMQNAELNINASFSARRDAPDRVQEVLTDSLSTNIKIRSSASMLSEVGHNNGIFADLGPVPPEVGQETTYTLSMQIINENNAIGDASVAAILPTYVTWLDKVTGDGSVTYDSSSRRIEWEAGGIEANGTATVSFGVSILPSGSQIGSTPVLMDTQSMRATDLYTGETISSTYSAVLTEMSTESGYGDSNGVVQQ